MFTWMNKILSDRDGNPSSKRLNGTLLIWIGIAELLTTACVSLCNPGSVYRTAFEVGVALIAFGCGTDIAGIFDGMFKK